MTPDPLFSEDSLRAHLKTPTADAPPDAWVRAVCAEARRAARRQRLARVFAGTASLLVLTTLAVVGIRLLNPALAPVFDAAITCERVLWSLADGAPALMADAGRQLAAAPFTPWLLLSLLALEFGALALFNRSSSHHA